MFNFGAPRALADHDKFVIYQLKYDERKWILVVCDGNIVGRSNDRPTSGPTVFDIPGAEANIDPKPSGFVSFGIRQHSMGSVLWVI